MFHFVPDPAHKVARVHLEPPLAGVQLQASVPLMGGDCADYRASLKPEFGNPLSIRFMGGFPASCSDKLWPVAYADPDQFAARAVLGMWQQLGGQLSGSVRDGSVPTSLKPVFFAESATLGEVVRDINKHSNNVMAEQLALTLAWQAGDRPTTREAARQRLSTWLQARLGWPADSFLLDNGSGLSRHAQMNAAQLGQLLQAAWLSPVMPEFMASLPLAGVDGTLSRDPARFGAAQGMAHLKTGSLRDVAALAGYVLDRRGQRWALVALLQHALARNGRAVLDAAVRWAAGA
jgi:D-alanyl-D-alanine carboxypeptidase/D-alanyl-D-alanine-endopeptidase (penicillin-binding protein 4)